MTSSNSDTRLDGVGSSRKFYAAPGQLWLAQRVIAQSRYQSWRAYPLYEMSGDGEGALILSGIVKPTSEMFAASKGWGESPPLPSVSEEKES